MSERPMKRIPISAGRRIADDYGYDQVIIIARRVGCSDVLAVTTYGVNKAHCEVAALIGRKFMRVMEWPENDDA